MESDKGQASERSVKSRPILARHSNGVVADHVCNFYIIYPVQIRVKGHCYISCLSTKEYYILF